MDRFNRQWQQNPAVPGENGQVQQTVTIAAVKSCSPSKAWTLRWFSASPHQGGSADLGREKAEKNATKMGVGGGCGCQGIG